jgi:hypothetical protein
MVASSERSGEKGEEENQREGMRMQERNLFVRDA